MLSDEELIDLQNRFTHHPPKDENVTKKYEAIRGDALEVAILITRLAPKSRERSLAITNIEQAVMWANAAIARDNG